MKRIAILALLLLCGAGFATAQQVTIQITKGVENPIPIAIVPFEWTGFGTLQESIPAIISNDLNNSGEFKTMSEKNMLSLPHQEKEVFYRDWSYSGQDYLVVGMIKRNANSTLFEVQYELFNVRAQKRMFGEVISGTETQLRDIAHQISDAVYEKITGIRGVFSTKILYITEQRNANKTSRVRLNMADADGGRPLVLLDRSEPILSPTWSPDGKQIAYVSYENKSRPQIFIQNLATAAREQLTDFPGTNSAPAFSPDGTRMAMSLSKDGNPEIYVMDLRSRQLRRITTNTSPDTEPTWAPDGKSLYYTSGQGGDFKPNIYQVNLDTLFSERVTYEGSYNAKPTMVDSKNLVLIHRSGGDLGNEDHVSVMNLEKGTIRELTDTSRDESPSMAPNGRMVIYSSKQGERSILNAVSTNGRVKFQLPVKEGEVREPAWSPFMP